MKCYLFKLDFQVRDYECDLQGIVNNAVYQNYLEHTRHEYLKTVGLDFAELSQRGIDLVLTRAELNYHLPLKSGDLFWIGLNLVQSSKLRFRFQQDIYRNSDQCLVLSSVFTATSLNKKGRPQYFDEIQHILDLLESAV